MGSIWSKQSLYRAVEAVLGRAVAWKAGRLLYLGARRELGNDPEDNGEYALIEWIVEGIVPRVSPVGSPRPQPALIDVGANAGDWTARALQTLDGRDLRRLLPVHAFEPAPPLHARLCARFAGEIQQGRVQLYRVAVGAVSGAAGFMVTDAFAGTSSLSQGRMAPGEEVEVEVRTLDDFARQRGLGDLLLVKVDTEGNDFNVIIGGARLLRERRVVALQFEYNWRWVGFGRCLRNVFDEIADTSYVFGRLTRETIEVHAEWHPELERYFEANYVLVREDMLPFLPHRRVVFGASSTIETAV